MARYIDIEGAGIGKANREQFLVPEFADGWNAVLKILEKEPTADVEEVRHGEWILHPDGSATCNQCKTHQLHIWDMDRSQNYCGRCGAKMDGGKNEKRS